MRFSIVDRVSPKREIHMNRVTGGIFLISAIIESIVSERGRIDWGRLFVDSSQGWWMGFVGRRGYVYKSEESERLSDLPTTIELLEEAIENDFNMISGEVVKEAKSTMSKTEKFSKKIQQLIDEEITEFFEELSS